MRVKVLLNPSANQRQASERLAEVKSALSKVALDYDLEILQQLGQAKQEAILVSSGGYDAIIAAGGDGTA